MQVAIMGKISEYPNDAQRVDEILQSIQAQAREHAMIISHYTIDQQDIFEDVALFLTENIQRIGKIEVHLVTLDQHRDNMAAMLRAYLQDALPAIKNLSASLYNGMSASGWKQLSEFLEGIQWILHALPQLKLGNTGLEPFDSALSEHVVLLHEALESKDYTLAADIIQYEMTPVLEQLGNSST